MQQTFCFGRRDQMPLAEYQAHLEDCPQCAAESEPMRELAKLTADNSTWPRFRADILFALGHKRMPTAPPEDRLECLRCKRQFPLGEQILYLDKCAHCYCRDCLSKYISKEFGSSKGQVRCPCVDCGKELGYEVMVQVLSREEVDRLQKGVIEAENSIVECVCKSKFAFEKGELKDVERLGLTGQGGKQLTLAQIEDYANNRYYCCNCKLQRCRKCLVTPYHTAYTCDEFRLKQAQRKCRSCDRPLAEGETCPEPGCKEIAASACNKQLACGHQCGGVRGQGRCLPCLQPKCAELEPSLKGVNADQFCNFCWTEALRSAPCVQSKCGHVFHLGCVVKRLQFRWLSPRIMFNFCLCPLCKAWLEFESNSELQERLTKFKCLHDKVQKKSIERLEYEGRDKDKELSSKDHPYFQRPRQYAMAIYAYFECFKCKEAYFGGMKNCQEALNEGKSEFKPEQLVCSECCDIKAEDCKKHGKEYIEFKCKFCCRVAQWFCWNTTHFCEPCHQRQVKGDYLTKLDPSKLPKCDPTNCAGKGDHPPNGVEFSLGCALCRNLNNRKF